MTEIPSTAALRSLLVAACIATAAMGCRSWQPAPIDLDDPGWKSSRGQAVWHPAGRDVELAGEYLVASATNGGGYVQFSKSPVVLAELRADPLARRWFASFAGRTRPVHGMGNPPARIAWAQLLRVARGLDPVGGWTFRGDLSSRWTLVHSTSGESIEGTDTP